MGAKTRAELAERLLIRRPEIEDAFLTRASAIGALEDVDDVEYQDGFRRAVYAAFDFTVSIIEREGETPPIPMALLSQARLAARNSVGLDTILRRYFAGSALLDSFVVSEIDQETWLKGLWQRFTYDRTAAFDFLIAAVTEEHQRELLAKREKRFDKVLVPITRILEGEFPERFDLDYDFSATHVAMVVVGPDARSSIRDLAQALDGRVLFAQADRQSTWFWIGRRKGIRREQLAATLKVLPETGFRLGVGEPGDGLAGWRMSHKQAKAALPIALRGASTSAIYGDVCIQASIVAEPLLADTLHAMYVRPLIQSRNGHTYVETLRRYFAADRNAASTAESLGVSRQTVASRLQAVEGILGCPLPTCADTVAAALRFHDWQGSVLPDKC
ncbi:MAG TPA: helix-turn-helix domain-containing protein [Solirubrobacterales bacterium]|nr:helix-turn-helix domain-containing protein [Solirubrobacterales bacterium]